ncbi:MAG: SDR family NAD(P)-dependent oxidoreductase [Spirochaetales bacterium]|nr:SDR family NAD(P)-dependent oxidoreductase [Spirochaetales bacterium]
MNRIQIDSLFETYGIDSIIIIKLINELEQKFGLLPKTLFFEYRTIRELAEYFLESHAETIKEMAGIDKPGETSIEQAEDKNVNKETSLLSYKSRKVRRISYSGIDSWGYKEKGPLDIAIIGLSGRFPQSSTIHEFWKNLRDGKDCITEIPKARWDYHLYFDADKDSPGKTYSKWGGFIDGADQFDPLFFNISPKEAEIMDPQERLFLQCAYETIEDAGYTRNDLWSNEGMKIKGNVGVFAGVMYEEYQIYGPQEAINNRFTALSGSPSSIANRVSYYFDFNGPSMTIDSMCSSSLTTVHLACQSLRRGECRMALAGGVNLSIHPNKYILLGQSNFVSSKGRCESFGQGGDGYVPGEGVGAVLLKPLSRAVADGDRIYGVIKGTAINHGGKTNAYTVPNPNAQASVIGKAFEEAGVNPRTVSYIEAHGTGTSLGDPIEIAGLNKAFHDYNKDQGFCAIGSVKSNIGHCESAAGIAGIAKVLLQLKYRQLVPSLHSSTLNPNIDFKNSPFKVQQKLAEWKRPHIKLNGESKEYPRIAGISAFGAGGSNAHIIIEEYIPNQSTPSAIQINTKNPAIILLSAKNENRLKEQAKRLLSALMENQYSQNDLADIAYTLQKGRDAMDERLAFIVTSKEEFEAKLESFIKGEQNSDELFRSQVKRNKESLVFLKTDDDMEKTIDAWISKKKYVQLVELWGKGIDIDWNRLYGEVKPKRISLPAYPFAQERYWAPQSEKISISGSTDTIVADTIHPLLHRNSSDFSNLQFTSTFTGMEFFLANHMINGHRIFPLTGFLEMARAAMETASGIPKGKNMGIVLRDIVWSSPIVLDTNRKEVHISLYPVKNNEILYEIYCDAKESKTQLIVHNQGKAVIQTLKNVPVLDMELLQSGLTKDTSPIDQYYENFKKCSVEYGPSFQGIEALYFGSEQVLAKLSLPVSVADTRDRYVIHPSILGAAIQATAGFTRYCGEQKEKGQISPFKSVLPFTLRELEIYDSTASVVWALIRYSDTGTGSDKEEKFDIDLCDEGGKICLRIRGFASQELKIAKDATQTAPGIGTIFLTPELKESSIPEELQTPPYAAYLVVLCETEEITPAYIQDRIQGVRCISLECEEKDIDKRFEAYTIRLFEEIKNILSDNLKGNVLIQVVFPLTGEKKLFSAMSGLLKTARLENPKLIGQMIGFEHGKDTQSFPDRIIGILKDNSRSPKDNEIQYIQNKRYGIELNEIPDLSETVSIPWKASQVYLITGGAGGLGLMFVEEIVRKVKKVNIILTGRSTLNADKQAKIDQLRKNGSRIEYRQLDITNKQAVVEGIQKIKEDFGTLNGIIHSAGVTIDNFILKKTSMEVQTVLLPKVTGLLNIDEATKDLNLDFFILFSSGSAVIGNPGQADYAAANAFMDKYAAYRNSLVTLAQRHGQTLSINWPLWKEGGMQVDTQTEEMIIESTGMIPMHTVTGFNAFYKGFTSGHTQVMVMEGYLSKMRSGLSMMTPDIQSKIEKKTDISVDLPLLKEKTLHMLKVLLGQEIKLNVSRIDGEEPLESYGIDSVMITKLNKELNDIFEDLSKTLFFEYRTLDSLSEYLITDYQYECMKWTGLYHDKSLLVEDSPKTPVYKSDYGNFPVLRSFKSQENSVPHSIFPCKDDKTSEPIAIIGISGSYPQSPNLNIFWENLEAGKDLITEIPEGRWDLEDFFDPQPQNDRFTAKSYCKWGGFLEGFADFDPLFFNISPREVLSLDPQERLFIQSCWEVFEDAGYTREVLSRQFHRRIGVFAGITKTGFDLYGPDLWRLGEDVFPRTSFSSLANRVSYFFDLQGPSMPVDTMCSSSLTAIHEACEYLHRGECEMAIAGGVNLYLHPSNYIGMCGQKMLSIDGRCKTFGQGANGFVPGEGVGAVLLKPLSRAVKDNDHVYAVIIGSSINHGGKTNGYTVPNPTAQGDLIRDAFNKAGVNARTVSYIEAHGTGTALGDPIEITGLKQAFSKDTKDTQFCSIGSVKSNIGHLEAASGIAGLTKIVLQMKHQMIAPSLHAKELNPNINFTKSPFIVQQQLGKWLRPEITLDGVTKKYPRIAGISSFGAGGTNVHIVLEEYIPKSEKRPQLAISEKNPAIIVLSARYADSLKKQAEQLLTVIEQKIFTDDKLSDIAYTLQVGREPMEERMGIIAGSLSELKEKLTAFLENRDDIENLYRGQVKLNKANMSLFSDDEELEEAIKKWIDRKKYAKLLGLWVDGIKFDWNKIYGMVKPNRISLPTYPFMKKRYWIGDIKTGNKITTVSGNMDLIHPLLHNNTSDFSEQRFTSLFTQHDFYIKDYVVDGLRMIPVGVFLEMARAGALAASGISIEEGMMVGLWNVVNSHSMVITAEDKKVHIGLFPEENNEISYEIYSDPEEMNGSPEVYNQGRAFIRNIEEIPMYDLNILQSECTHELKDFSREYENLKKQGLSYGPSLQGVTALYTGQDKVLAKIIVPSVVLNSLDQYVMHPSIIDSALQSIAGLIMDSGGISAPFSDFTIDELEVYSDCKATMWALIQHSDSGKTGESNKVDIDVCDETGMICIRIKGFSSSTLDIIKSDSAVQKPQLISVKGSASLVGNIILNPVWDAIQIEKRDCYPVPEENILIIGGTQENKTDIMHQYPNAQCVDLALTDSIEEIITKLKACGDIDHIVLISPYKEFTSITDEELITEQNRGVIQVFRVIKSLFSLGYKTKVLGITAITIQSQPIDINDSVNPTHASIHGLIGSMAKEYQNWKVRVIDLDARCDLPIDTIFMLPTDLRGRLWVYRGHQWFRQRLLPLQQLESDPKMYKTNGVYVILGGAGDIGRLWTEYMIRTYQAHVIWIGRRKKDEAIQSAIDAMAAIGPVPFYITADITDRQDLQKAYDEIKKQYSHINGIVHSALVFFEKNLIDMTEEDFRAGLSVKVNGSVRIAQVFNNEPLDFVMFFSSIISFIKNTKQSHYASGCTFKDSFAHQLSREWPCAVKIMNWGYWSTNIDKDPGVVPVLEQIGIGLIESPEAMHALEILLAAPKNHMGLMKILKPLKVEGMDPEESLTLYQEKIYSTISDIQNNMADRESELIEGKPERDIHFDEVDDFLSRLLWAQLQSIGLFTEKKIRIDDLKSTSQLHHLFDRWLDECIAVFARKKYLKSDGVTCSIIDPTPVDREGLWKEWDTRKVVWLADLNKKAQVVLVEATLRAVPEIVTGKIKATDIMFPNSSMVLVEGVYKYNRIADYFSGVVADTLVTYIQDRIKKDRSAQIRILEIGAGTGGTSAIIFPKIQEFKKNIEEYCYTDLSKAFLMHAQKEYGPDNPYLTYKIFNVENPIAGQGIPADTYDIVIAANVLHATKNIRQTLRNAKAVLKKNGMILLNEMSGNNLFMHLTFGLLEGWWLYEDSALRIPGSPGLSPDSWQRVLETEGFRSVFFPVVYSHDLGQQIIVAESDGAVRQKQEVKEETDPVKKKIKPKGITLQKSNRGTYHSVSQNKQQPVSKKKASVPGSDVTDQMIEDHVRTILRESVAEVLKVEDNFIDDDSSFSEYGVDSIVGVMLVNLINKQFSIDLPTTVLFDYNNVTNLCDHIITDYKPIILSSLQEDVTITEENNITPPANDKEILSIANRKLSSSRNRFQKQDINTHHEIGTLPSFTHDPIAIIGMSGQYAKSENLDELWKHLESGTDLVNEVTRWDLDKIIKLNFGEQESYCKYGSFLESIDQFDSLFFNISGLEANYMDPEQRFFLETSWKALEDAGYAGERVQGLLCGVYVGCEAGDYRFLPPSAKAPTQAFWGNSSSMIPARIAYYLNLQGPAIAVDTACSSSLVAVHLACQGLWANEIQMAIAGGVSIRTTPTFFVYGHGAGMLSHTGHCYTFDERADGFVPGEGVGAIVLKRLKDAQSDGDHIYGVIRGSGINQDGTSNGITAPSAKSQERLERHVYDTFHINPEDIQIVEAHGTGTKLGDPIEYDAIKKAFRNYTDKKNYCAIGTIKTNIGHTAAASGVSGIIKVLLSLKNNKIPPSLNFKKGNPHIQFDDTPFYINTSLKKWERNPDSKRLAVVSAFGFSGTNAHIAIEEAPEVTRSYSEKPGYMIVLSALSSEQLYKQVEQLVQYCEENPDAQCGDISYTLLLGRKHFYHRLACVVRNLQELIKYFRKWLEKEKVLQIYVSKIDKNEHREQTSLKNYGNECIRNCQNTDKSKEYLEQLSMVADLYVQGYSLDFEELYANNQYCNISLPTYPFVKKQYWIPKSENEKKPDVLHTLHPLLHENTSDFYEQRFSSLFNGTEFFINDYVINRKKVLPGVSYLEMARESIRRSSGTMDDEGTGVLLHSIESINYLELGNEGKEVNISLVANENEEILYEIYTDAEDSGAEAIILNKGRAVIEERDGIPTLDLQALRKDLSTESINISDYYDNFTKHGMEYGPAFKGIEALYKGQDKVLAKISLPVVIEDTLEQCVIHPNLIESAIQAIPGLLLNPDDIKSPNNSDFFKPILNYSIEELEVFNNCQSSMWAFLRFCEMDDNEESAGTIDIDICDEIGTIILCIKGFSTFLLEGRGPSFTTSGSIPSDNGMSMPVGNIIVTPIWDSVIVEKEKIFPSPDDAVLIIGGTKDKRSEILRHYPQAHNLDIKINDSIGAITEKLNDLNTIDHIIWIAQYSELKSLADDVLIKEQKRGVLQIFRIIKSLLSLGYQSKDLGWTVLTTQTQPIHKNDPVNPAHASIQGLIGSMAKEYSNWKVRIIDLEAANEWPVDDIFRIPAHPQGELLVYRNRQWYLQKLIQIQLSRTDHKLYRENGVYVVIGGAGGIGEVWTEYMIRNYKARIIWIGRRAKDDSIQAKIDTLGSLGPAPRYISADAADLEAFSRAYDEIIEEYKEVNGVIHSAIVLLDQSLLKMEEDRFKAGLSAKIDVSVRMAQVFRKSSLDFVMFFSSINSFEKPAGQSNYASGCTFKDAFAHQLALEWPCTIKVMNWGYWGSIGIVASEEYKERMAKIGLGSIEPPEGMEALEKLMAGPIQQVGLIKTTKPFSVQNPSSKG